MILLDTSVIISFLKGEENKKVDLLERAISKRWKIFITPLIYTEVLMGSKSDEDFLTLKTILSRFSMIMQGDDISFYENSAILYKKCRKRGVNIGSIIDVMIAVTAIHNDLMLLHNDKDYRLISNVEPKLKFLETI